MTCTSMNIEVMPAAERRDDVKRMLVEHQCELRNEIQNRVRDVRETGTGHYRHLSDLGDSVDGETEDDLTFALIHIKAEMLQRVSEAVRQCDEGSYGYCLDCRGAISSSRLRAMPFAVRCRDCEAEREAKRMDDRQQGGRWAASRDRSTSGRATQS